MTDQSITLAAQTEELSGIFAQNPIAVGVGAFVIMMVMLGITYAFRGLSNHDK